MHNIKYIVYKAEDGINSIMFPAYIEHATMAKKIKALEVKGAGFCYFKNTNGKLEVVCHGESLSLNIHSRPLEDTIKLTVDYIGLNHVIK